MLVPWQTDKVEPGCFDTEHFSPRHDFHWHLCQQPGRRPLLSFLLTIYFILIEGIHHSAATDLLGA